MSYDLDVITEARRGGKQLLRTFPCHSKIAIAANVTRHVLKRKDVVWWSVRTSEEKRRLVESGVG